MKPDLSKYQRQITLKSFGLDKQLKLFDSKVLIVGMGGLGIPVAQYLNAMGVGTLGLMDNDIISQQNLHRQVLYITHEVGQSKVEMASKKLRQQNPETVIYGISAFLHKENALQTISEYDVVVDASDNFATRYLINDACVILNKPLIYGALHDFEGQVSVFNHKGGPTYRCLFPNQPSIAEIPNCDENGVLGVLPGIIGSLQALEVIKVLTGVGEVLSGKLLLFNGLTHENRLVQFKANPENQKIRALQSSYDTPGCATSMGITAQDFLELSNIRLIDVRSKEEFANDHLQEAQNLPLAELEIHLNTFNGQSPVYFICQSGKRSAMAVEMLLNKFPKGTFMSVEGGMNQIRALCH